jgi:hypothetical protein
MSLGGAIEGDRRLRAYELMLRHRSRKAKVDRSREAARIEVQEKIERLEREEAEWERKQVEERQSKNG